MHHIDRELWNHNSLSPGDVDGDGFEDYAVIHEGPDKYSIVFHPGESGDVRAPWRKVIVGGGANIEYSYLGDFDGDGNLDIVGVEGLKKGRDAGVRILWSPGKEEARDGEAWADGGLIPGTENRGHYLFVEARDINGDGATDIITGGRVLKTNRRAGGLVWIEAPADPAERRNLSRWRIHDIDPNLLSGHGFVFTDIDEDGHDDIVICNADWDTPDSLEAVLWYRNPGPGSDAQRQPWRREQIHHSYEYYPKAQVGVGDLNGDGLSDLAVQTFNHLFWFRKTGTDPVAFELEKIRKPAVARWLPRPTKIADLDEDGQPEVIGMLIHYYGALPKGKASVFRMRPRAGGDWEFEAIKMADGSYFDHTFQGEKWDHMRFVDVDGDGDRDIVGNCEEHYGEDRQTVVGVVWFENPLR
jgi:hypothetical protein